MERLKNKWVCGVIPALLIHCSVGSVYAFSLLAKPISQYLNCSTAQAQFSFSLAIFFLGFSAAFGGSLVEKDIKKSTLVGLVFFISGLLLAGFSIYHKSLLGLYIGYGVVMGIGLGVSYLSPVKTLMMWFENQKGLATGIAITGFGFASAIASPLITYLLSKVELYQVFIYLAIIYVLPMFIAHLLILKPQINENASIQSTPNLSFISVFKNKTFILIWLIIFINISCGLALISVASPLMTESGMSKATIALIVGIMGVFNGSGRMIYSTVSDKLKDRRNIYMVVFILSITVVSYCIAFTSTMSIIVLLLIISSTYGAGFSCLPSLLSDRFGMNHISQIHGLTLTAWGCAGLIGNQISALVKAQTGSYLPILYVLLIFYFVALIVCNKIQNNKEVI